MDRRAAGASARTGRVRAARGDALRGVDHRIVHRPGEPGGVSLKSSERGPLICVSGERPHVARRVTDFLRAGGARISRSRWRGIPGSSIKPRRLALRDTVSR